MRYDREEALSIQRQSQVRHAFLLGLATTFAAVTILYSALWMYVVRRPSASVKLGFNKTRTVPYEGKIHGIPVLDVVPGSPAERAGLRPGDLIVGIHGTSNLGKIVLYCSEIPYVIWSHKERENHQWRCLKPTFHAPPLPLVMKRLFVRGSLPRPWGEAAATVVAEAG